MSSFCKSYSHFFSKKFQHICVSLDVNFNESLTNDVVSFKQLGPGQCIYSTEEQHGFTMSSFTDVNVLLVLKDGSVGLILMNVPVILVLEQPNVRTYQETTFVTVPVALKGMIVVKVRSDVLPSRKHVYIIVTPLNPPFI